MRPFSVCVYCGSRTGAQPAYAEAARAVGRTIGERGWRLVYGGGAVGLMGIVADAALAAAIGSAVFSFLFYQFWPALPFMDRVGLVFLLCLGLAIVVSLLQGNKAQAGAVELNDISFDTSKGFNLSLLLVVLVLVAFYSVWW